MIEEPLYNGSVPKPAAPPPGIMPRPVGMNELQRGKQMAAQNAVNFFENLEKESDFTQQMEQERAMMESKTSAVLEADRRLNLPDGDEESFFDSRGVLRTSELQNFLTPYKKQFDRVGQGILNGELAAKMQWRAAQTYDGLMVNLLMQGRNMGRQRAAKSLQDSITYATETGNFGNAYDAANEAHATGIINDNELNNLIYGIHINETENEIQRAVVDGTLPGKYANGDFGELSPEMELKVRQQIDIENTKMLRATREIKRDKNGTLKEEKTAPSGLTPELLKYYNRLNDPAAPPLSPQERQEGIAAFAQQLRNAISDPNVPPELIEAYKKAGSEEFGISVNFTQKIAEERIAELKGGKPGSFKNVFERVQEGLPFLTPQKTEEYRGAKYQYDVNMAGFLSTFYGDGAPIDDEDEETLAKIRQMPGMAKVDSVEDAREIFSERLKPLDVQIRYLDKENRDNQEKLLARCSTEMLQWEADNPQATSPEVAAKRIDLIEKYRRELGLQMLDKELKNKYDGFVIEKTRVFKDKNTEAEIDNLKQDQIIRTTDAVRKMVLLEKQQLEKQPSIDLFNIDTTPTAAASLPESSTRPIVYVPVGEARNKGTILVQVNGLSVEAELREKEHISEAVFSNKLRSLLCMNGSQCSKPFALSIKNGQAIVSPGRIPYLEKSNSTDENGELSLIATPQNDVQYSTGHLPYIEETDEDGLNPSPVEQR